VSLSLQRRRVGDIVIIKCTGRIVFGEETTVLQQQVYDRVADDPYIVLNLAEVDFIDSSGLGLLVRFLNRSRFANGDLKLCAVPARIDDVLRITRLKATFDVFDSEADAIAAFYQRGKSGGTPDRFRSDILCVDKSADVLAYICELLKQAGYGVLTSDNLPDALLLLKATPPKVVVIGAELRAARDTWTADTFNSLASTLSVIELPADFSIRDAGEAGHRLLDRVRSGLGEPA
jgi:anti-sigma B factor antagonist